MENTMEIVECKNKDHRNVKGFIVENGTLHCAKCGGFLRNGN